MHDLIIFVTDMLELHHTEQVLLASDFPDRSSSPWFSEISACALFKSRTCLQFKAVTLIGRRSTSATHYRIRLDGNRMRCVKVSMADYRHFCGGRNLLGLCELDDPTNRSLLLEHICLHYAPKVGS